jgi:hypothetical protein
MIPACRHCGSQTGYQRHITETVTTAMNVGVGYANATERMLHKNPSPWACTVCNQKVLDWNDEQLINFAFQRNGGLV